VLEYSEGLMMQMRAVEGTVAITAIDPKNRMVVFQTPGGELYQVKAAPGVHLEKAKVGDQLVTTYTQSVALRVEPAAPSASSAKAALPKK